MYISQIDELQQFYDKAKNSSILAVDTEFLREKTYHPKLCLIQMATRDEVVAIDPLAIDDLSLVKDLLEDAHITKIFHSCSQDLEVLRTSLDAQVTPIFDTQVAASFLGVRHQIGYSHLVESICSVKLAKAESLTDWAKRPLDKEQLRYAEEDVIYLPEVYDKLLSALISKNRLGWFTPEMESLVAGDQRQANPREAFKKVKRINSLTSSQLAIARELCEWRELTAQKRNVPRKWILADEILLEIAKRAPETPERLKRIRGIQALSAQNINLILKAVERGVACPEDERPKTFRRAKSSVETESVVDLMYAVLRIVSDREGISGSMLANREDLLGFVQNPKTSRLGSGWRYDVLGSKLEQLLEGNIGLTVKDGKIEFL